MADLPSLRDELASRIKHIALDLDGTTLTNDKRLTERTAETLQAVAAAGLHVTFVTGRMLGSTAQYAELAGLAHPHVVLNGSLVTHQADEPLFSAPLPRELVAASLQQVPPGTTLFWLTRDALMSEPRWEDRWIYMLTWNNGLDHHEEGRLEEALSQPVYQLHWVGPKKALDSLAAEITDPRLQTVVFSSVRGPLFHLEARSAGTHKATGMTHLQRHFGVAPEATLAIGDWLNDTEMISQAGVGVAMGNAIEAVKQIADLVLDLTNEEDGVADFLERVFL